MNFVGAQAGDDIAASCEVLAGWDRTADVGSRGTHIWTEFWEQARRIPGIYAVPFDTADPVNTPRGLALDNPEVRELVTEALAAAEKKLAETGIALDARWGDIQFADALEAMGAKIEWGDDYIKASRGELKAVDMDMNHIPDAAMTIAVAALFAQGTTKIRNVYNWRVKETDRLYAMATELRKVGASVVEGHDFIEVTPPAVFNHAQIDTYDDHRMAMCFSLVALSGTAVTINDPKCTSKTFPDYFAKLASVSC